MRTPPLENRIVVVFRQSDHLAWFWSLVTFWKDTFVESTVLDLLDLYVASRGQREMRKRSFYLLGCGVSDLAHEKNALGGVLHDQDQEGSIHFNLHRHTHGHHLQGRGGRRFGSCFINVQNSLVGRLRKKRSVKERERKGPLKEPLCMGQTILAIFTSIR